jgi:hypothetical protein
MKRLLLFLAFLACVWRCDGAATIYAGSGANLTNLNEAVIAQGVGGGGTTNVIVPGTFRVLGDATNEGFLVLKDPENAGYQGGFRYQDRMFLSYDPRLGSNTMTYSGEEWWFNRISAGSLPGNGNLAHWAEADPATFPVLTNYLYASDIVCAMDRRTQGAVTNAMTGDMNVLVTNICVGSHLRMNVLADGTARTVAFFWPAGVTVSRWTTNATVNGTNLYVMANKRGVFFFECSQTNVVTAVTGGEP